jgi:photosystem II stability/assembly factor-like uncharacterized protein
MAGSQSTVLYLGTGDGLYRAQRKGDGFTTELAGFAGCGEFRAPVVADVRDPRTVYAGTTKAGMFRSRDAGQTWHEINNGIVYKNIWSLVQHPTTGALYAGTSPAGVFVSTNQGDSWAECDQLPTLPTTKGWTGPVPPHVSRLKGLALSQADPQVIYGAIEEGWAVRSQDGGHTWEQIATGLNHDGHWIVTLPSGPRSVVASTGGGMFRSDDGGEHWLESNKGLEQRRYTAAPIATHAARPGMLMTAVTAVGPGGWRGPGGGDSAFARSDDGGLTWRMSTKGLPQPCAAVPRALTCDPDSPDTFYAGMTDGTVWLSEDGGESFRCIASGLPPVMSIGVTAG